MNGKGSVQRPAQVSEKQVTENWKRTFATGYEIVWAAAIKALEESMILDHVNVIDTGRYFHERYVLKALRPLDTTEILEAGRLLVGLNGMGGGVVHTRPEE